VDGGGIVGDGGYAVGFAGVEYGLVVWGGVVWLRRYWGVGIPFGEVFRIGCWKGGWNQLGKTFRVS